MSLVIDIETGPQDESILLAAFNRSYIEPSRPGEFDPASVRVGNLKDQAKIAAKIEEARQEHAALVANHTSLVAADRAEQFAKFASRAALDPCLGCVLAVGIRSITDSRWSLVDGDGDEREILQSCWVKFTNWRAKQRKLIGHNLLGFDLPFLCRRSWILGVDVPSWVRNGRYWDAIFVDTRDAWLCGQRWGDCDSSLDVVSRALGVGGKPDGITGADFARLWRGTPEEREQAKAYLANDLELTAKIAVRMGVA